MSILIGYIFSIFKNDINFENNLIELYYKIPIQTTDCLFYFISNNFNFIKDEILNSKLINEIFLPKFYSLSLINNIKILDLFEINNFEENFIIFLLKNNNLNNEKLLNFLNIFQLNLKKYLNLNDIYNFIKEINKIYLIYKYFFINYGFIESLLEPFLIFFNYLIINNLNQNKKEINYFNSCFNLILKELKNFIILYSNDFYNNIFDFQPFPGNIYILNLIFKFKKIKIN